MYFVPPKEGEKFYLRLLLLTVRKGPKSFEDLRTVNNHRYESFQQGCLALGLLEDDREWQQCLNDATIYQLPRHLHNLFVLILKECHPACPAQLWQTYKQSLCDDLCIALQRFPTLPRASPIDQELIEDYGLFLILEMLRVSTDKDQDVARHFYLPEPVYDWSIIVGNRLIAAQ